MSPSAVTVRSSSAGGSRRAQSFNQPKQSASAAKRRTSTGHVPGARKIVNTILPGFSRQLGAMLHAGMPLVASLDTLEEQSDNPNFKRVVTGIKANIENGSSLSEALAHYPAVFDELYSNMVRSGESGGKLPETVHRLAILLETSAKLRRKVKSAMMYPTIVLTIALAIATAMIIFIVPVFGSMYEDFGATLPGPTQFLLDLSDGIKRYGIFIVIGLVVGIVAFKKWKQTPAGGLAFDRFLLKVPVFGELNRKVASARFARTFGQMIRSGVPILDSLEIVSGATGNKVAGKVILGARTTVEKGEPLSSAMLAQPVFPIMLVRMLQAGEKTGKIDEMMDSIADFYDDEVETMLAGLTSLLEPLLIVFLGIIIGGIVLCMFLPIFKMGEIVSG